MTMKMNMNDARLISFITSVANRQLNMNEISNLNDLMVDREGGSNGQDIRAMFEHMRVYHKIDAIKLHRQMTGYGLKESKDEIEFFMSSFLDGYCD